MGELRKYSGVVHADFLCEDCGARFNNYRNAQALAAKHAKSTGHFVRGEIGIAVWYNRKDEPETDA